MLKEASIFSCDMSPNELKQSIRGLKAELSSLQQQIKEKKVPVFVTFDGYGSAGVGTLIGKLISELDPRFYNVIPFGTPTLDEKRKPFLWRYGNVIPEAGKFVFLDSSWMEEIVENDVFDHMKTSKLQNKIDEINIFERQLTDNGYVVLKFFLNITKEEQEARIKKLSAHKHTTWRVSKYDKNQLEHRKKYEKAYDAYMNATNNDYAPWHIIDAADKQLALYQALLTITTELSKRLTEGTPDAIICDNEFPLVDMPPVCEIPLDQNMNKEEYEVRLKELQKKLKKLHNQVYKKKIPIIIAYEGWDAAGKGGNIKRLSSALDPRGFEVFPIASPEPHEKSRHYLWRFSTRLPKDGHIAIFDRTWYGRVMVERLEGFCSQNDWQRAYREINEFEKGLSNWGAIVIKFWVQIDKGTQLYRFTERQNTPEKQWKITDEDWRNREKWDQYEEAVNEMIQKTSTTFAPWHILPSNNKYFARITALETVIAAIEARLKEE